MQLYYQIALTNVLFDNSYKNVIRFENRSEQEAYFNVSSLFSNRPFVNFNVGSLLNTTICYDCLETDSINELLSKNYCIVKDTSPTKQLDYYYYFITNSKQENENRISLSIELDVIQTYYLNLQFSDCLIHKAHLNRFIEDPNDTSKILFDGDINSKLFEREDIQNVAKRLTKRTKLSFYDNSDLGKWFENNVSSWVYIFVSPIDTLTFNNIQTGAELSYNPKSMLKNKTSKGYYPSNLSCFVYPIYREGVKVIKFNNNNIQTNHNAYWGCRSADDVNLSLLGFEESNGSYIYNVKILDIPPFKEFASGITYTITSGGQLQVDVSDLNGTLTNPFVSSALIGNTVVTKSAVITGASSITDCCVSEVDYQEEYIEMIYENNSKFSFEKYEIVGSNKNSEFNPKLLSLDYKEMKLCDQTGNGFSYDLQKLNSKQNKIRYIELINADITKKYIAVDSNSGYYSQYTKNAMIGFINSNDTSVGILSEEYQKMLSNQKNYFLQNSVNRSAMLGSALTNIGTGVVGGMLSGAGVAGGIIGGITGAVKTGIGYAQNKISEKLTIDNLRNTPDNIGQVKGNVLFQNSIDNLNGAIVEEYDITPNEKEMINDYMCMYGFTYNRIGNVKEFDNIRKFYNYIQADIEQVEGSGVNINDIVHSKLRQIYANGIRFWNYISSYYDFLQGYNYFDYKKENYETWIANDFIDANIVLNNAWNPSEVAIIKYGAQENKVRQSAPITQIKLLKESGTITISSKYVESVPSLESIEHNNDATVTTQIVNNKLIINYTNVRYMNISINLEEL